jgi:hypothetical protein
LQLLTHLVSRLHAGWLVRLDVGLAWFAALATLILVPTDVAATLAQGPPGTLAVWWRVAYWWAALPCCLSRDL